MSPMAAAHDETDPNSVAEPVAPSFRLDDQIAVVTGGGRGIGRGCALALAAVGAEVVVLSRTASELEEVVTEIGAMAGEGRALSCDVTEAAEVWEAIESLDRVDIVVNAAGGNIPEPFLEVTPEHVDAMLALNVKGTLLVAQATARRMIEVGKGGSIINLSSQMGHVGASNRTVYCAAKHAVEGLTKAMAVELAAHAIRVNTVAPTFIDTPMTRPFFADPSFRADVVRQIPLGRIGKVSDVAGAVVYLASPASSMVTGASLLVDGGWTAQ
jgi:NAD(P)-dependent dehydrogenase (short-subunit alcohol dehydrogenase family)